MTLDEAIAHAREKASGCGPCAEDHRQLAEWLEELRSLRPEVERLTDLVDGATYGHARRPTGWRVIEERDRLRAENARLKRVEEAARTVTHACSRIGSKNERLSCALCDALEAR